MLLGLDNSRARGRPQQPLTRVAFYSSYWIDNRTGMDLMFQDHAAAQPNPFLLGARMPGAYAEVLVPGGEQYTPIPSIALSHCVLLGANALLSEHALPRKARLNHLHSSTEHVCVLQRCPKR